MINKSKVRYKIIAIIILITGLSGCDIFKPRKSEEPTQPQKWNEFFTAWELTLENLEFAYEDKRNKDNYVQILTEDFEFYMDDNDALDLGLNKQYSWDRQSELNLLENMHAYLSDTNGNFDIMFSVENSSASGVNEMEVDVTYDILITANADSTAAFNGNATIYFEEDSGYWYLKKFYDSRNSEPTNPTWGKMKYEYVQ